MIALIGVLFPVLLGRTFHVWREAPTFAQFLAPDTVTFLRNIADAACAKRRERMGDGQTRRRPSVHGTRFDCTVLIF